MTIQVGANDSETISIDLKEITSKTLGAMGFNVNGPQGGVTAVTAGDKAVTDVFGAGATAAADATTANTTAALRTALGVSTNTGATASLVKDSNGKLFMQVALTTATNAADVKALNAKNLDDTQANVYIAIDSSMGTLNTTTGVVAIKAATTTSAVTNAATANPLATLDKALASVDALRSSLGAVQNRFESAINNLSTTINNLSASRSRIEDADYATEVSNMTRANILQQAGTSVLSQANQTTQNVLSLLR